MMLKKLLSVAVLIATCSGAVAQSGQLSANQIWGNPTGAAAPSKPSNVGSFLTQGTGVVISGTPKATIGLATQISAGGPTGSATQTPVITYNAQGQLTVVTLATIAPPFSAVTGRATLAQAPQGIANSIWINPTGSTADMQNVAVPACANDGAHGLVYVNGSGLACATLTTGGTVTSAVIAGTAGNIGVSGTCTITTTGTCTVDLASARKTLSTGCAINATATATCFDGSAGANNGTYTTPANALWLEVELVGGGGGGCGSGTTPGAPGAAGNTTFGTLTATGAANCSASAGGAGGVPTGAAAFMLKTGGKGGDGSGANSSPGGIGCASPYGGNGAGGAPGAGVGGAATANTGSGGGGGGVNTTANGGGGGACGGFIRAIIPTPSATYSYAIGAAGTAGTLGTGGAAGGLGGSGYIQIIPHFN